MADAYNLAEKKGITDVLKNKIRTDRVLHNKPVSEIKNELYNLVKSDSTLPYAIKKKPADDVLSRLSSTVDINTLDFSNPRDRKTYEDYVRKSDAIKDYVDKLETGVSDIIDEFLKNEVTPVVNLAETYHKIATVEQPIKNVDEWLDERTRDTLKENETIRDLKESAYISILTNYYLTERITALIDGGVLPQKFKRIGELDLGHLKTYLFHADESERAEVQKLIGLTNTNKLAELAKSKFEDKLRDNEKKMGEENTAYESITKELNSILYADDTDLIDRFNDVAVEYGYAKLRGNSAGAEEIKKGADYGKIRDAVVKSEAHEKEIRYGRHSFRLDALYEKIINAVRDGFSKSEAVKALNEISGRVGAVRRRVESGLDETLTSIYRNVLAGSDFDTTPLGKKKKYMIIHDDTIKTKWDEKINGIHAEAGLGWYYNEFVGDEADVVQEPGYTEKIKHAGKRFWGGVTGTPAAPMAERTARQRLRAGKVSALRNKIIAKHKHAAYHELSEENVIEIDEAVGLGMGLAAELNGPENIAAAWNNVGRLNHKSSISDILDVYLDAAELGAKINEDSRQRTMIVDEEFEFLDDYLNKNAGILYRIKDDAMELVKWVFKQAKLEGKGDLEKNAAEWTIHDTAIKPNKEPLKYALLAAAGLAVGTYAYIHDKATGEALKTEGDEKSDVLSFWEALKEITLIKLFAPRH